MRTLNEIIEATKDGEKPPHDECYFAMLALDALSTFTTRDLRNIVFKNTVVTPEMLANEDHKRWQRALNKAPDEWLGPHNHPGNPDQLRMRRITKGVLRKVGLRGEDGSK